MRGNITAEQADIEQLEALWHTEAVVPPHEQPEMYGHSLRVIHNLGGLAVNNLLETPEGRAARKELLEEYRSSVAEMIKTDVEFRSLLEINREDTYRIKDGKVLAYDNKTPVVKMVGNGVEASAKEALKDPRMRTQAQRDAADLRNALAVDAMQPGTARIAVSMDPKEAMGRDGRDFWEGLGYREGMGFMQWYVKRHDGTVLAGTYSVDHTDLQTFRAVWARAGGTIPEGLATDQWLDCAITAECGVDQAREVVERIRGDYYRHRGVSTRRYDINTFMDMNNGLIAETFQQLYVPMAMARASGVKNKTVHAFAESLLTYSSLKPETRSRLEYIYYNEGFDDESARCIESLIRYGAVERLRPGLEKLGRGQRPVVDFAPVNEAMSAQNGAELARMVAGNVAAGAKAGRSYGSCGSKVAIGKDSSIDGGSSDDQDPQRAYGGKATQQESEEDEDIPPHIRCPECRVTSPKEKVIQKECWCCPNAACGYKIDICTGAILHESDIHGGSNNPLAAMVVELFTELDAGVFDKAQASLVR